MNARVPQDYRWAAYFFGRGCDAENLFSCYLYAEDLEKGQGVLRNYGKAFRLFEKVCRSQELDQMAPYACVEAGKLLLNAKNTGLKYDHAHAIELFHSACMEDAKTCGYYEAFMGTGRVSQTTPPAGALGFRFGANLAETKSVCRRNGGRLTLGSRSGNYDCSSHQMIPGLGLPARGIVISFCDGRLCQLNAIVPVSANELIAKFDALGAALRQAHGAPFRIRLEIPRACDSTATISRCLAEKRATIEAGWAWQDSHLIHLLTAPDADSQAGSPALVILLAYSSPEASKKDAASGL